MATHSTKSYLTKISLSWNKVIRVGLALLAIVMMAGVVFSPYIPFSITFKEGEISQSQIKSPRTIIFESSDDQNKTKLLRAERSALVEPIFTIDEDVNKSIIVSMVGDVTAIKEYREKLAEDKKTVPNESIQYFSPAQLRHMSNLSEQAFGALEYAALQNMEDLLDIGIQEVVTKDIKKAILANTKILWLPDIQQSVIVNLILNSIKPNKVYNEAQTQAVIQSEINSIKPFTTTYREGQPIVYKGEVVTLDHIEAMKALNIYGSQVSLFKFIGIIMFIFMVFALLERFIYFFNRRFFSKTKYYVLTYTVMMLLLAIALGLMKIPVQNSLDIRFFIPISIGCMVLSLMITPNIALISGTLMSVCIALLYHGDFSLFIYLFLSSSAASFSIYKKTSRAQLMTSGYVVGFANMASVVAIGLFQEAFDMWWFSINMAVAFLNGVLSAMLSLAILPYFEKIFGITTQQSLLELSNLNHPLMKKMMMTAPGTYQHSLMVANLAEAAAEAVNADPVMCRVGAYFHDIGKMKRPLFFIENQYSGENPHNTLSPRMSKMIIASHTKDGLEMAKKYKLPQVIQDMIMEHHGDGLVSYFYNQALQTEDASEVDVSKDDFRYSGPKPHFKESGILMLADSVEAAVRSLEKPTPIKIETMVNKIFKTKLENNQLDDCPITLKEVETVRSTIMHVLHSMYHTRIEYKDDPLIASVDPKLDTSEESSSKSKDESPKEDKEVKKESKNAQ